MIRRSFLKAFALPAMIPGRGKRMPFGNAVGEGFVNGGIVVARKVIVEGTNGGVLVYSSAPPALGNLTLSDGPGGTDSVGNTLVTGNTTYFNISGSLWIATSVVNNGISWYLSSTGSGGVYSLIAQMNANTSGSMSVQFAGTSGTWPQSGGSGITTVAQLVTVLENLGLLTP